MILFGIILIGKVLENRTIRNEKRIFVEERNILVCVTQQKNCERLINSANELIKNHNGELHVINVVKDDVNFLDSSTESEALEYLFSLSKSIGANLAVLKSDDIPGTIARYADENNIHIVILGKSRVRSKADRFLKELKSVLKNDIEVRILS